MLALRSNSPLQNIKLLLGCDKTVDLCIQDRLRKNKGRRLGEWKLIETEDDEEAMLERRRRTGAGSLEEPVPIKGGGKGRTKSNRAK